MKLDKNDIQEVTEYCVGKSEIEPKILKWVQILLNDLNSSNLREAVTCNICNYDWIDTKKGYDAFDKETNSNIEIKPKLFTGKRTDGSGNFSDLTMARIQNYENNLFNIVCSLFCNNRLMYVMEFPYNVISKFCRDKVYESCVVKGNKYARCISFNYKHYLHSDKLKIHYIDMELIEKFECVNKKFLEQLKVVVKNA